VQAETSKGLPLLRARWSAELLTVTFAYFRQAMGFRMYAYAVLPHGFEAVIQPDPTTRARGMRDDDEGMPAISKIMMEIKGSFAHWYNRKLGRSGSVWEKRFQDRILLSAEEIRAATLKVHAAPIALGLADRIENYPFTGLTSARNPIRALDKLPVSRGSLPAAVAVEAA
jgi:hypothetical protein